MPVFRPDACIARWLDNNRNGLTILDLCSLCLYTTNRTWLTTDDTAQATAIEATFGGYSRQTITDWGAASVLAHVAEITAGIYSFVASGSGLPVSVYGAFILDQSGDLLYVEPFQTGAIVLSSAGDPVNYRPAWSDKNI